MLCSHLRQLIADAIFGVFLVLYICSFFRIVLLCRKNRRSTTRRRVVLYTPVLLLLVFTTYKFILFPSSIIQLNSILFPFEMWFNWFNAIQFCDVDLDSINLKISDQTQVYIFHLFLIIDWLLTLRVYFPSSSISINLSRWSTISGFACRTSSWLKSRTTKL